MDEQETNVLAGCIMLSGFIRKNGKVVRAMLRVFGLHTRFPFPEPSEGQRALEIGAGWHRSPGYEVHELIDFGDPRPNHVFDLNVRPWPLPNNCYDIVVMRNVLEHLDDTVGTMEEVYRVSRHGARVLVRVPHWHSSTAFADPTHKRFFDLRTFMFFDKRTALGMRRDYYSSVDFSVEQQWLNVMGFPIDSSNPLLNFLLAGLAMRIGGMVHGMTFFLKAEKPHAMDEDKK